MNIESLCRSEKCGLSQGSLSENIEDYCIHKYWEIPIFVHMKGRIQNVDGLGDKWTKDLNSFLININDLRIENYRQIYPFHYVDKNFLSKEIVDIYEEECLL